MRAGPTRRRFLRTSAGVLLAGAAQPDWLADLCYGDAMATVSANDRPLVGAIGVGARGSGVLAEASRFGDVVAICDVDRTHAERANQAAGGKADIYGDYRKLLERKDVAVVTIGTPDHWHSKIAIEAMRAGKDVYCEKPLSLTIGEGQQILQVTDETRRIVQVGTQQRSEMGLLFLRAAATVRSGQLGKITKVTVTLPLSTAEGGPFEARPLPENLDWNFWLGQAPLVDYCPERCHSQFRWWYEYSGGIVTDWGAHHLDIVHWALDADQSGPLTIDGSTTRLPSIPNGYNTPKTPVIRYTYPDDVLVEVTTGNEGILFEGDKGRIFVNRGRISGTPIEDQDREQSLRDLVGDTMSRLYNRSKPGSHMANFFESVKSRQPPVSNVQNQHRSVTACHLGNISIRLGRKLTWDPKSERFAGDEEADAMIHRTQREPYQIKG